MICPNEKCGRKINVPLELFNGTVLCPYCKQILSEQEFKFTVGNVELYKLSELYYMRYLFPDSYKAPSGLELPDRPVLLDDAIKHCKRAAWEGNIFAAYRMGYYNEYYFVETKSEADRIKNAFNYYYSVCFYPKNKIETESGVKPVSEAEIIGVKKDAAKRILKLLSKHKDIFKGGDRYDRQKILIKIKETFGASFFEGEEEASGELDKVRTAYKTVCSCVTGERRARVGIFFMTGEEIKRLFAVKRDKERGDDYDFINLINRGVEIRYIPCKKDGGIEEQNIIENFVNFPYNVKKIEYILEELGDENCYYLFFFNLNAGKYLNGNDAKTVREELVDKKNGGMLLAKLINHDFLEYLFFDDDFETFRKKGKRAFGCAEKLIDYLWENE